METYDDKLVFLGDKEPDNEKVEIVVVEEKYNHDINSGYVIINEEKLGFSKRDIFEGIVFMTMPNSFELMPIKQAMAKYPSYDRPGVIFTNPETNINVTLSYQRNEPLENDGVEELKNSIQDSILEELPKLKIIESNVISVNELNIAYFDFIASVSRSQVYNLIYIFSLEGVLVIGSFNCLKEDMVSWKEIFFQMIHSISLENYYSDDDDDDDDDDDVSSKDEAFPKDEASRQDEEPPKAEKPSNDDEEEDEDNYFCCLF